MPVHAEYPVAAPRTRRGRIDDLLDLIDRALAEHTRRTGADHDVSPTGG